MQVLRTGYVQVCDGEIFYKLKDMFCTDGYGDPVITSIKNASDFLSTFPKEERAEVKEEIEYTNIIKHFRSGTNVQVEFYVD